MKDVTINGRFLAQPFSGVQRFAFNVLRALDRHFIEHPAALRGRRFRILSPRGARDPGFQMIEHRTVGRLRGQAWEQFELPWHARGVVLLNLGNTAPLAVKRQVVTIYDVASWVVPEAFSPMFRRWYRFLIPRIAGRARTVLTVSNFSASEITKYIGVPRERLRVIYSSAEHVLEHSSDPDIVARAGLGGRIVLSVGNRAPHKNFGVVLRAEQLLRDRNYTFVHAGEELAHVFGGSGATYDSAHSLGRVTDTELRALYEAADCFVFPSIYEGFGMPPLEAMSCGCAVVASSAASMPEICGDAALYFDPLDPTELAGQIARIMDDGALRDALAERGLARAREFSWERSARALLAALDEVSA